MKTHNAILIVIVLLSACLRFWSLSTSPSGFNADEAALGYNAGSLLATGRDEHGHPLPVNLESFGDFKPALYAYLLIPALKLFPPTPLLVRLPAGLAGVLQVVFIYYLARKLFGDRIGLASAFLLAVSPWAIHFSRGAWEVNVATLFLLLGACAFMRYRETRTPLYFGIFTVTFVLSLYTYQSTRLIAPLLALGLLLGDITMLRRQFRLLVLPSLAALLLAIPVLISVFSGGASSRLSGVGLLADTGPINRVRELRGQHKPVDALSSRLLHNRPLIYLLEYLSNYLDHFDGSFLFIKGDPIDRNRIPEMGVLYLADLPLLILGCIFLSQLPRSRTRSVWLWLLIAPAAAAATFQTPHALRSQNMIIPISLISACGLYYLSQCARHRSLDRGMKRSDSDEVRLREDTPSVRSWVDSIQFRHRLRRSLSLAVIFLFSTVYIFEVISWTHQYFVHYPRSLEAAWEYGFDQVVAYVSSVQDGYDQILVTDKYDQPYIFFLFYQWYPFAEFQTSHQLSPRDQFNFSTVRQFSKYRFTNTSWETVRDIHSSLIVASPEDIPADGVNVVKTINFPSGRPAFKIISN